MLKAFSLKWYFELKKEKKRYILVMLLVLFPSTTDKDVSDKKKWN